MTLSDIQEWVDQEIRLLENHPSYPETGEVLRMVNEAQDYISRELMIPTTFFGEQAVGAAWNLPADVRDDTLGILAAWDSHDYPIPIFRSMGELTRAYPDWADDRFQVPLMVYDPSNTMGLVIPRGFRAGDTVRFLAVVRPRDLFLPEDVPFNGQQPDFHRLIPLKVSAEFLKRSLETNPYARGNALQGEFDKEMRKASARSTAAAYHTTPGPRGIRMQRWI